MLYSSKTAYFRQSNVKSNRISGKLIDYDHFDNAKYTGPLTYTVFTIF